MIRTEDALSFIDRRIDDLQEFKLSETTMITLLANQVWPGNSELSIEIEQAKSLESFRVLVQKKIEILRKRNFKKRANLPQKLHSLNTNFKHRDNES